MTRYSAAECLAAVEESPAAVAVHDKARWLSLFARSCVVEDPVGSRPHICRESDTEREPLSRFYDTFIAPNEIRFDVDQDIVCGLHVMRDITIEIRMSPRVTVRVPVHLLYELVEEAGTLKVSRLAAHWELLPMLKQQMASGLAFAGVGTASGYRLLRYLGFGGMLGFMRALSSVGDAGKEQLAAFGRCLKQGDAECMNALFVNPAIGIGFPRSETLSIEACAGLGGEMLYEKVLAAGNVVSASVTYATPAGIKRGVVLCEFESPKGKIAALDFYW